MTKKAAGFGMQLTHIPLLHTHTWEASREKEEANEFLYLLFTVLQQHPEKKEKNI
jgi:hypothetical protein